MKLSESLQKKNSPNPKDITRENDRKKPKISELTGVNT